MKQSRPLPVTHPEYSVLEFPGYYEYRIENWHLARDGSGRVIRGARGLSLMDAFVVGLLAILWPKLIGLTPKFAYGIVATLLIWQKITQVMHESVVVIPQHGLQLETHCGFPPFVFFSSKRFVARKFLQDVIINEGLRRWDVRYYLAAIRQTGPESYELDVAYENILPHYPVLRCIYNSIQDTLIEPAYRELDRNIKTERYTKIMSSS
ncbi:hypothetical protein BDN72DRAFT_923582 [Pluteus cervinus]|uniref:Uncharacterized protein n=1 Tax=Pluteus cervinus TaxID=181527 RepID=A0ACD3BEM9_9AGAR|nr:hypothetical protein BDN72DRAFT_923582 [Pluteus cervinus]